MPEQMQNPRELRGLAILSNGNAVNRVHKGLFLVRSQTGVGEYEVHLHKFDAWTCTCPDWVRHKTDCKHIFAVRFSLRLKKDIEESHDDDTAEAIEMPQACPSCDSPDIIRRGIRHTQKGDVQRYSCRSCGYYFVIDKGFSKMKHDPTAITLAMDLYFKGISYRKICDHLKQFYSLEVDHTTPLRWVQKYLKLLAQYSEKYKAEVGDIWHSDEMTCFIKKEGEKGYYEWIWNIMDAKTRYLLACKITKEKHVADARIPLRKAKRRASTRPMAIVTDGLASYKDAIKHEFYSTHLPIKNPHFRLKDFETKPNNNILERLNGTCRERLKVMRSLNDPANAMIFADGFRTYYNYIRPHQALDGKTPSEMAGIPIDLSGNRWMKMIELASQSRSASMHLEGGQAG